MAIQIIVNLNKWITTCLDAISVISETFLVCYILNTNPQIAFEQTLRLYFSTMKGYRQLNYILFLVH